MSEKYGTSGSTNNADRSTGDGFPKLFINASRSTGGENILATKNIPFEIIKPSIHHVSVEGATVTGQMRTVSTQSISGFEIPYVDKGFEDVILNTNNYLDSTRAIFSKVNEDRKLNSIEGNKSLAELFLSSTDTWVLKLNLIDVVFTLSNRVNAEVDDYATDPRVNAFEDLVHVHASLKRHLGIQHLQLK